MNIHTSFIDIFKTRISSTPGHRSRIWDFDLSKKSSLSSSFSRASHLFSKKITSERLKLTISFCDLFTCARILANWKICLLWKGHSHGLVNFLVQYDFLFFFIYNTLKKLMMKWNLKVCRRFMIWQDTELLILCHVNKARFLVFFYKGSIQNRF